MNNKIVRRILPTTKDFKAFWKKHGPFKYALTSAEFPPILLEPEEWIFSDNIVLLLKDLMQWDSRNMAVVEAPFNKNRKNVLKPELLIPWKIENFPEEWQGAACETFTPLGYLTEVVATILSVGLDSKTISSQDANIDAQESVEPIKYGIEAAFFKSLENNISKIGYVLLKPEPLLSNENAAYINSYLQEWQEDEEAG